jgi:hypothetical protein
MKKECNTFGGGFSLLNGTGTDAPRSSASYPSIAQIAIQSSTSVMAEIQSQAFSQWEQQRKSSETEMQRWLMLLQNLVWITQTPAVEDELFGIMSGREPEPVQLGNMGDQGGKPRGHLRIGICLPRRC